MHYRLILLILLLGASVQISAQYHFGNQSRIPLDIDVYVDQELMNETTPILVSRATLGIDEYGGSSSENFCLLVKSRIKLADFSLPGWQPRKERVKLYLIRIHDRDLDIVSELHYQKGLLRMQRFFSDIERREDGLYFYRIPIGDQELQLFLDADKIEIEVYDAPEPAEISSDLPVRTYDPAGDY